jgi:hypothetical protein
VRGKRASIAKTAVDLVLVSARYKPAGRVLLFARGYARRGQVWTDIKIYDRASLVEALKQSQNVVVGRSLGLAGDFEILSPVHLSPREHLRTGEKNEHSGDDLGLPIL